MAILLHSFSDSTLLFSRSLNRTAHALLLLDYSLVLLNFVVLALGSSLGFWGLLWCGLHGVGASLLAFCAFLGWCFDRTAHFGLLILRLSLGLSFCGFLWSSGVRSISGLLALFRRGFNSGFVPE